MKEPHEGTKARNHMKEPQVRGTSPLTQVEVVHAVGHQDVVEENQARIIDALSYTIEAVSCCGSGLMNVSVICIPVITHSIICNNL